MIPKSNTTRLMKLKLLNFVKKRKKKLKLQGLQKYICCQSRQKVVGPKNVLQFGEKDIINLEFSADSHSVQSDDTDDAEPEIDIEKDGDQIKNSILKFEFVNPLSYVGLKKPSNSFELLYLCKIVS